MTSTLKTFKTVLLSFGFLAALAAQAQAVTIDGFRSARFGADENTVMQSAIKDLHVSQKDIVRTRDAVAQVTVLTVKVNSFEPLNMPATVNYVLGYKCNCLTQATVQWSFPDTATAEQRGAAMVGVSALVNRFAGEGWEKDKAVVNRVLGDVKDGGDNTLVLFRGQTEQASAITLAAAPVKMTKDKAKPDSLAANVDGIKVVSLVYERDAANPDIKRIDVSGF